MMAAAIGPPLGQPGGPTDACRQPGCTLERRLTPQQEHLSEAKKWHPAPGLIYYPSPGAIGLQAHFRPFWYYRSTRQDCARGACISWGEQSKGTNH